MPEGRGLGRLRGWQRCLLSRPGRANNSQESSWRQSGCQLCRGSYLRMSGGLEGPAGQTVLPRLHCCGRGLHRAAARLPAVSWRTRSFTAESSTSSREGSGKASLMLPWEGAGCLRFRGRVRGMTLRCEAGNDLYGSEDFQNNCAQAQSGSTSSSSNKDSFVELS